MVYFRRGKGQRFRMPDLVGSEEFNYAYSKALEFTEPKYVRNAPKTPSELRRLATEKSLREAIRRTKTRANKKGMSHDLTRDFLLDLAESQNFCCKATGIEFYTKIDYSCRVSPYAPSIDRIDNDKGYTCDNVRLVIFGFNTMVLDWGDEAFEFIARSYIYKKRKKNVRTLFQNPDPKK